MRIRRDVGFVKAGSTPNHPLLEIILSGVWVQVAVSGVDRLAKMYPFGKPIA